MNSYQLTARAEDEIIDIFSYGIERFGLTQARLYKEEMKQCFQLLGENPRMGRPATAIGDGIRRHEHGSHVILYEIADAGILVLAVVHGKSVNRLKL